MDKNKAHHLKCAIETLFNLAAYLCDDANDIEDFRNWVKRDLLDEVPAGNESKK